MTPARLFAAQEATWPPAAKTRLGPVTIREGQGGGQRVSAATVEGPVSEGDITAAEVAMARLGQVPLFMIRPGDEALDEVLDARGYRVVDPVCVLAAPVETVAQEPPPVTAFTVWQPLAIMEEIWDACGIGPARRAVMARSTAPRPPCSAVRATAPPAPASPRSMTGCATSTRWQWPIATVGRAPPST